MDVPLCVAVHAKHTRGGQRTTCRSWFSHSTMSVLGMELRLSSLVVGAAIL